MFWKYNLFLLFSCNLTILKLFQVKMCSLTINSPRLLVRLFAFMSKNIPKKCFKRINYWQEYEILRSVKLQFPINLSVFLSFLTQFLTALSELFNQTAFVICLIVNFNASIAAITGEVTRYSKKAFNWLNGAYNWTSTKHNYVLFLHHNLFEIFVALFELFILFVALVFNFHRTEF